MRHSFFIRIDWLLLALHCTIVSRSNRMTNKMQTNIYVKEHNKTNERKKNINNNEKGKMWIDWWIDTTAMWQNEGNKINKRERNVFVFLYLTHSIALSLPPSLSLFISVRTKRNLTDQQKSVIKNAQQRKSISYVNPSLRLIWSVVRAYECVIGCNRSKNVKICVSHARCIEKCIFHRQV